MAKKDATVGIYSVYIKVQGEDYFISVGDIENFYFIEDLFSYSIVGKIQFNDRNGIGEFGPITGYEELGLIYGLEDERERVFNIFKINRMIPAASSNTPGASNYLEILFVDEMFYNLTDNVYSVSWKNTKHSEVVKDIANNALNVGEFEEFEESNEKFDYFYMPYWTPKQTIDWIMRRCSGSESGNPGYIFYNNSIGCNFVTLDKLLGQNELMTINDEDDGKYVFKSENIMDPNKIISFQLSGVDNHAKKELKGGYRLGYDFDRKKFIKRSYTYSDSVSQFTLLGRESLFPDISEENTSINNFGENSDQIVDNIYQNEWIKRYSMQQTMNILVQGHEERYAGGMIEIVWPSHDEKEMYNKNMGGKYLIKSITHQFGNGSPPYRQKLILIKNAYEDTDNVELVSTVNKNLGS